MFYTSIQGHTLNYFTVLESFGFYRSMLLINIKMGRFWDFENFLFVERL